MNRHGHLEDEIKAYEADIERLKQLATLMTKAENLHNVSVTASFWLVFCHSYRWTLNVNVSIAKRDMENTLIERLAKRIAVKLVW